MHALHDLGPVKTRRSAGLKVKTMDFETAWNISKHRPSEETPYQLRHGTPFLGQTIPLGARVPLIPAKAARLWLEKKPFANRTVEVSWDGC